VWQEALWFEGSQCDKQNKTNKPLSFIDRFLILTIAGLNLQGMIPESIHPLLHMIPLSSWSIPCTHRCIIIFMLLPDNGCIMMHLEIFPSTDIQISHDVTSLGLAQDTAAVINVIQFAGPLFRGGSLMH
jgi:hypothetical protein